MNQSSVRRSLIILAAAAAGLQCRGSRPQPTQCTSGPQNHVIEVTPTSISCKSAIVSIVADNHILWYSASGTTLTLQFAGANPYKHFGCGSSASLPTNECKGTNLSGVQAGQIFEYTPSIDGTPTTDPNIIIRP
jgi:hypothetical protein